MHGRISLACRLLQSSLKTDIPGAVRHQNKDCGSPQNSFNSRFLSTFRVLIKSKIKSPRNHSNFHNAATDFYPFKHSFHSFYSFLWRKGWFRGFDFWSFLATKQYFAFRNDHFQFRENCKLLELTASLIHLHFQISDFPRGSTSDFSWLVECFKFWSYRMFLVLWDAKKEKKALTDCVSFVCPFDVKKN